MKKRPSIDPWLAVTLGVGALFLLTNLGEGNGRLWQDEAETGVLGRNTLHFGYPRATDESGRRLNPALPLARGEAWTYHPWFPFYIAAGSFFLLGAGTLAARLPFALMGLLSIWLTYRLVHRLTRSRSLARWTAFILTVSVPFLLLMRQCRYYAPSLLLSLWALWAYARFRESRRWSGPELAIALALLAHTNHGVFIPLAAALALHLVWSRAEASRWRKAAWIGAASAALALPVFLFLEPLQHRGPFSFKEISHHAQFYFRQINRYLLPVVLWAVLLALWRPPVRLILGEPGSPLRKSWGLIACVLGVGLLFLIFIPVQRHFRYLASLLPWLLMVHAALLSGLWRTRRAAGLAVGALLLFTDLSYSGPTWLAARIPALRREISSPDARVRSYPLEFAGELTHVYRGPMDGIVEFLSARARPGQTVKIPYGDNTLLFYTELAVEPVVKLEEFSRETYPDWIVIRRPWLPSGFLESAYFQKIRASYDEILLDAPDIPWQNRPDPGYHRFRTDTEAPNVRLFRKKA